jgi:ATP-dependent DNA helicase RecG
VKRNLPITDLLAAGMGPDLHWFPEDVDPGRLAETFAGMANTNGGTVLIGVSPRSGRVVGLQDPEATIDRVFRAALLTDPPLVLPLPTVETSESEDLLQVLVPDGMPHIYTVGGRYLGREGRHNTPITPASLRRKLIERGAVHYEAQPIPGAGLDDLDSALVDDYAHLIGLSGSADPQTLLLRRGCLVEAGGRFLSNLRQDPGETVNLAGREPKIVQELENLARSWELDVETPQRPR